MPNQNQTTSQTPQQTPTQTQVEAPSIADRQADLASSIEQTKVPATPTAQTSPRESVTPAIPVTPIPASRTTIPPQEASVTPTQTQVKASSSVTPPRRPAVAPSTIEKRKGPSKKAAATQKILNHYDELATATNERALRDIDRFEQMLA